MIKKSNLKLFLEGSAFAKDDHDREKNSYSWSKLLLGESFKLKLLARDLGAPEVQLITLIKRFIENPKLLLQKAIQNRKPVV